MKEFNIVSKDENKIADNVKKQTYSRYTILADVAKKATKTAKKANLKITIE